MQVNSGEKKPNFLFIMTDQHRCDYIGSGGASWLRTPALDALSQRGMRFTDCTTNAPVCAPARIGLATGLQPSRLGAVDNSAYLPLSVPTYYQRLRDHGYRVGCVGKLDLAKPEPFNGRYGQRPCAFTWGFTHPIECEGKQHAGRHLQPVGPYTHYLDDRGLLRVLYEDYQARSELGTRRSAMAVHDSVLPSDAYEDAYIGRHALAWIDRNAVDFPWHLFVSFVGPHPPFDPPTEYADRYRKAVVPKAIGDSLGGKPAWLGKRAWELEQEAVDLMRRQYCAMIELIDDQVNLILKALEDRGLLDNTYIIFTSDHGEMLGDHGLCHKNVAYEPALRVPLMISGPGIEGGSLSHSLVELIDVNATICELAGLLPQGNVDARSFAPVLFEVTSHHRSETVSAERNFRCIRTEEHKLIQNYNDIDELYDLREDPFELGNMAASKPELVAALKRRMVQRFSEGPGL